MLYEDRLLDELLVGHGHPSLSGTILRGMFQKYCGNHVARLGTSINPVLIKPDLSMHTFIIGKTVLLVKPFYQQNLCMHPNIPASSRCPDAIE